MGRDSAVGIATHYRLDSPGIETQWGRDFLHLSRLALGPVQPPTQWVPGHGIDHPHPTSTKIKEGVQLYLYSTSGPLWPVIV